MAQLSQNRLGLLVVGVLIGLAVGTLVPPAPLHAWATHASQEGYLICTGELEPEFEGVYYFNYKTGDLRGVFFSSLTNQLNAVYEYNILKDFGIKDGKKEDGTAPKFLIVTGHTPLRQVGNIFPSTSIIYIVEESSGKMCAFAAPYGPNRAQANPSVNQLRMIATYTFGSPLVRK